MSEPSVNEQVETAPAARGSAGEVFRASLGLGLTSFGGPIAHLGYFERAYVRQRHWLSSEEYAGLVALCQMLPGPASSQVGILIGLRRANWPGALAAWLGFTLPSALAMAAFALVAPAMQGPALNAVLHGLKLVAVAVVSQAVWSMAQKLCPDRPRTALALLAAVLLLVVGGAWIQDLALVLGAVGGALFCRNIAASPGVPMVGVTMRAGGVALVLFLILLIGLPLVGREAPHTILDMASIFYRAGALVFGGGHVVLPLLRDALVPQGWLSDNAFLAGYGAAQAIPGPLFTFSAYLGATIAPVAVGALLDHGLPRLLFAVIAMCLLLAIGTVLQVRRSRRAPRGAAIAAD